MKPPPLHPVLKASVPRAGAGTLVLLLLLLGALPRPAGADQHVQYSYDAAGRLVRVDFGQGHFVDYTYDASGNLVRRTVIAFTDTDKDFMDDAWEMHYFGSLERDGSADFDHDGQSDLAEFLAGTDPADPSSVLKVTRAVPAAGAGYTIEWASVPGRRYQVQYKDDLNQLSWSDLGGPVTAAASRATRPDDTVPAKAHRFYRVLQLN
jgi:YD repeat-containing protein